MNDLYTFLTVVEVKKVENKTSLQSVVWVVKQTKVCSVYWKLQKLMKKFILSSEIKSCNLEEMQLRDNPVK